MPPGWSTFTEFDDVTVYHSCNPSIPFRFPILIIGVEAPRQPVIHALPTLHHATRFPNPRDLVQE
jgi:hypothetical protein